MVPLLEKFVREHPDFSYRGAKAIVGMTGYEGVYGYRTDIDGKERLSPEAFEKEVEEAKKVTQWLRENGWELASHSYGHPAYGTMSTDGLKKDVARWEEEVQPIVGDTDIILYPHGSDIAGVGKYSGEKYEAMYAAGYRFFCNVDSSDYWVQIRDDYVRQGRRNLDGYRMWYGPHLLDDLFNTDDVFDPARPTPVPPI
jgi:peptidoglycan/xylan/chitin deacetylase (PgdA/CDA1 family)